MKKRAKTRTRVGIAPDHQCSTAAAPASSGCLPSTAGYSARFVDPAPRSLPAPGSPPGPVPCPRAGRPQQLPRRPRWGGTWRRPRPSMGEGPRARSLPSALIGGRRLTQTSRPRSADPTALCGTRTVQGGQQGARPDLLTTAAPPAACPPTLLLACLPALLQLHPQGVRPRGGGLSGAVAGRVEQQRRACCPSRLLRACAACGACAACRSHAATPLPPALRAARWEAPPCTSWCGWVLRS